jgi:2',3'-cyclic-nucleotide 2'-phosphodiesterase (5'-nucleotidase family)
MKNKLLAGIFVILILTVMAGCKEDDDPPPPPPPALDWSKAAGYDPTNGDRILGKATAALDGTNGRYQETVLGNFFMDGLAEYARYASGKKIDFALFNDAFIRSFTNLPAGDITNSTISVNGTDTVVVSTFTGKQVRDIIEGFVSSTATGTWARGCAPMVSKEVSYTIDTTTTPPQAKNIKVNGAAINDTKEYRVAGGNFIGDNTTADRFIPVLDAAKKEKYAPTTVGQAVAMYVLAKGTINPADYAVRGRITGIKLTL